MTPQVGSAFFLETDFGGGRHPHYGRFLRLLPDPLIELMGVTPATHGLETIVTVELSPVGPGTGLRSTRAGFPDNASRTRHLETWGKVLAPTSASS